MATSKFSDEIVIRFAMTKGEGDFPDATELSETEMLYPQSMCSFLLDLDYGKFEDDLEPIGLTKITILYNGVDDFYTEDHHGKSEINGISWSEDEGFVGYPSPIIKFKLIKPVDKEKFFSLVMASSVRLSSAAQDASGNDGFYYEDYNGWASIIEGQKLKKIIQFYQELGYMSDKEFDYVENDHIFPLT